MRHRSFVGLCLARMDLMAIAVSCGGGGNRSGIPTSATQALERLPFSFNPAVYTMEMVITANSEAKQ